MLWIRTPAPSTATTSQTWLLFFLESHGARFVVLGEAPPRPPSLRVRHGRHRIPLSEDVHQSGSSPGSTLSANGNADVEQQHVGARPAEVYGRLAVGVPDNRTFGQILRFAATRVTGADVEAEDASFRWAPRQTSAEPVREHRVLEIGRAHVRTKRPAVARSKINAGLGPQALRAEFAVHIRTPVSSPSCCPKVSQPHHGIVRRGEFYLEVRCADDSRRPVLTPVEQVHELA